MEDTQALQPDIKIFVAAHKQVSLFDSRILQPVQVGSLKASQRFANMHHDDEGENIAELNPMYCELTAQYWAWKNQDADYYGFCHYRRYFNFSNQRFEENPWGEIMDQNINTQTQARYGLTDENIAARIADYDVVTTEWKDLRNFPESFSTPLEQYHAAEKLIGTDLDLVFEITKQLHPDYVEDVDSFANGNFACFCNMFIMKKALFQEYCAWLFPILQVFCELSDMSSYSREALRTPGHLSERLLNVFLTHQQRINPELKLLQTQCVHFEHPEPAVELQPLTADITAGKPVIPVVFASDNGYVPMVTTTIYSMLKNASPDYHYDVVVLEKDITAENKKLMQQFFAQFSFASIRFYNVVSFISGCNLVVNNEHISIETYYRFLIQEVMPFYDKVLYLDSDLAIEGDVSELYNLDLQGNYLAAVHDLDFLGNLNTVGNERLEYNDSVLHMQDPYQYFQAGVLLFDTKLLRENCPLDMWFEEAANKAYIYNDQDILNRKCEGHVLFMDFSWNVMNDCAGRIDRIFSLAPAEMYNSFMASRAHQRIIHYAGFEKPWNTVRCDMGETYWKYARETPFYEILLARLCGLEGGPSRLDRIKGSARSLAEAALPQGTTRRKIIRDAYMKVRR